ncbi:MAG: DUF1295 domain-containing protein [Nitrospirae bacterium]|nr:MAG: DUF1295 domain-containing protein [Nitrospirota bacterium]
MADLGFCVGFGLVAVVDGLNASGDPIRRIVVATMAAVYAWRLGFHLFVHRIADKPEDARYRSLRKQLGRWSEVCAFVYFQGQAVAVVVLSVPLLVLMAAPTPFGGIWDWLGVMIGVVGVGGEAWADWQLAQFKADSRNRNKVCQIGWWRYSRHPNYFFDVVHWWAYPVMGLVHPNGWLTMIAPLVMMWALLRVSGVPYAEAQALASKGEAYRRYQATTSVFIPWRPKRRDKTMTRNPQ